jgi:branched-chain amino acid transport system substrate-binding protein
MRNLVLVSLAMSVTLVATACNTSSGGSSPAPIKVGAIYPLTGSQGPGGINEFRGVKTAVAQVNAQGGVDGRRIQLVPIDVPGTEAVSGAMQKLSSDGVRFVLGSYGSTISVPASRIAEQHHMLFWESGAVGERSMMSSVRGSYQRGDTSFRIAPTGMTLGGNAISFLSHYAAKMNKPSSSLRVAITSVDDVYGRSVARGAMTKLRKMHLTLAGHFTYDPRHFSAARLARRIARSKADVLFAAAYLDDGVALVHQLKRQRVPLLTAIGTSSSFCLPQFGKKLGPTVAGLFASDKPDASSLPVDALNHAGATQLRAARASYTKAYRGPMGAPALAGYAAAWALFHYAMQRSASLTPESVASEARSLTLPQGSLPNGSGIRFSPGAAGFDNAAAVSVIWEWFGRQRAAIVWPRRYATAKLRIVPVTR